MNIDTEKNLKWSKAVAYFGKSPTDFAWHVGKGRIRFIQTPDGDKWYSRRDIDILKEELYEKVQQKTVSDDPEGGI